MARARRRLQQTAKLAAEVGNFDEYPSTPEGIDPQLMISRNSKSMPFFLVCEKDTLLVQMSGAGRVEFKDSSMNYTPTAPGDYIYVPARTPHRITCNVESVIYKYKAAPAGLEAMAFYCDGCGECLYRSTFDTTEELPQEGYVRITDAYNSDPDLRKCDACGTANDPADVSGNNWAEIAAELRNEDDDDDW